jgi:AraC-like DNA-binding protein/ligand-binding sensor protein
LYEFLAVVKRTVVAPVSSAVYDALARSQLLRDVESAFRDATGLSVKLVPGDESQRRPALGRDENVFCALMAASAGACAACVEVHRELQRRLGRKLAPQEICCFAGMIGLAVPVVVGGQHVATLLGGQVFRRKLGRRQFDRLARQVRKWGVHARPSQIKQAYFHTPVVSEKQFQGGVRLLTILATQLAEAANRYVLAARGHEPPSVTQAKTFVHAHAGERVTLGQTAAHVNVSRNYFCKIFKQAMGMTFTEFVARVRVENAKGLLSDPRLRITDVADSAGFNSFSQFNRVFHRYAGISPTAYRAALLMDAGVTS